MIPIWHQEEGKWYLIPTAVRNRLKPGDTLQYDARTGCWITRGPGFTFMETITVADNGGTGGVREIWGSD